MQSFENSRSTDIELFYQLLGRIKWHVSKPFRLADVRNLNNLPQSGVEFYFEDGEYRFQSNNCNRVVRVGYSESTPKRLTSHNKTNNSRFSVFRNHLSVTLAHRDFNLEMPELGTIRKRAEWVKENCPEIEPKINKHIKKLKVLILEVENSDDLKYIRKNAIRLLSNFNKQKIIDPCSDDWLGKFHYDKKVKQSHLWNCRLVKGDHDSNFCSTLESLIEKIEQKQDKLS